MWLLHLSQIDSLFFFFFQITVHCASSSWNWLHFKDIGLTRNKQMHLLIDFFLENSQTVFQIRYHLLVTYGLAFVSHYIVKNTEPPPTTLGTLFLQPKTFQRGGVTALCTDPLHAGETFVGKPGELYEEAYFFLVGQLRLKKFSNKTVVLTGLFPPPCCDEIYLLHQSSQPWLSKEFTNPLLSK